MQFIFQKKSLILSIIFFVFSCFVFVFLYREVNGKREILQQAQEKWQTETTRRENARSLVNSIEIIKSERNLLETHFVQSSDVVPFLDTIEKLAKEVGAEAEVVSVNIDKDSSSLMVEMKAQGSFETIYKLIMLLEHSPYNLEFVLANIQNRNEENISANKNNKPQPWIATFQIKVLSFVN